MSDELEKIIRPIVEGQIRGFLKEHPSIAGAVDWYKPEKDKVVTFTNSLAKRIVNDLICAQSKARMRVALLEVGMEPPPTSAVAPQDCGEPGALGIRSERAVADHEAIEAANNLLALKDVSWDIVRQNAKIVAAALIGASIQIPTQGGV